MKIYRKIEYNCIGIKVMSQSKILFILFTFVHALSFQCPVYRPNEALPSTTCLKKSDNDSSVLFLKKCEPNLVCNAGNTGGGFDGYGNCTEKYLYVNKYPGEYCTKHDNCSYSKCTNNKCMGKDNKKECRDDYECDAGLRCDTDAVIPTCVNLIEDEKTKCNDDYECQFNRVCNKNICVLQGSLDVGAEANNNLACKTLFKHKDKCAEGPKLDRGNNNGTKEEPIKCPDNGKCFYYINATENITTDCVCARGVSPEKICPPGVGDFDPSAYLNYAKGYTKARCTSPDRLFCKDKQMSEMGKDYYNAYIVHTNMTRINVIHGNTFYTKYILSYDYWYSRMHTVYIEKEEVSYAFLFATLTIILVGDGVLLVLYFRKLKKDAEIIDGMN